MLPRTRFRSTELNIQEDAGNAWRVIKAEEATQRLRALDLERQHELDTNEQKLRDESIARSMQQRLIELDISLVRQLKT